MALSSLSLLRHRVLLHFDTETLCHVSTPYTQNSIKIVMIPKSRAIEITISFSMSPVFFYSLYPFSFLSVHELFIYSDGKNVLYHIQTRATAADTNVWRQFHYFITTCVWLLILDSDNSNKKANKKREREKNTIPGNEHEARKLLYSGVDNGRQVCIRHVSYRKPDKVTTSTSPPFLSLIHMPNDTGMGSK